MHSKLALAVVKRFCLLTALFDDLLHALGVARFEFEQVLCLGRLDNAHGFAVALASDMALHQPDLVLLAVDIDADAFEVGDQPIFLDVTGFEQPQLAAMVFFQR